ncbi:hypothetical protein ACOSP7_002647 [Xanthoceras sorbifolium]
MDRKLVCDKCSGPCSNGYRCSSYCKEFAEEIKKMHDDFHHTAPGYCAYHRAIDFETLEEMNKGKTTICLITDYRKQQQTYNWIF